MSGCVPCGVNHVVPGGVDTSGDRVVKGRCVGFFALPIAMPDRVYNFFDEMVMALSFW